MKRVLRIGSVLLVVGLLAAGCSKKDQDDEKVVEAIDNTTPAARRFVYRTNEGFRDVEVRGLVEDDFRYKLQLFVDGKDEPAIEQVVVDDAVAIRFLDPSLVDAYLDPEVQGKVDLKTSVPGATVIDALRAKRWVVDLGGAPSAVIDITPDADEEDGGRGNRGARTEVENDPLFDARNVLSYVRGQYLGHATAQYDDEAITKTYRTDEDPFPKPEVGAPIARYDTIMFPLPPPADATGGAAQANLPFPANFRRMATFIRDDRVIAVKEIMGLTPRLADDLTEYIDALLTTTGGEDLARGFRKQAATYKRSSERELQAFLMGALNTFLDNAGDPPLVFREMSLDITDFDADDIHIKLPNDHVIIGDLAVLRNMGRKPIADPNAAGTTPSTVATAAPGTVPSTAPETTTTVPA